MESLVKKLVQIQSTLKAPKNQYNSFGKYKYRSCEDIVEAVKPLLAESDLFMFISDKIVFHSELRCYVEATVTVTDGKDSITATGFARESTTKKGMDDSQITGATSSYARKYALNGMFGIDDTKDADHDSSPQFTQQQLEKYMQYLNTGTDIEFYGYVSSLPEAVKVGLHNSFPDGKKTEMKRAAASKEQSGINEALAVLNEMNDEAIKADSQLSDLEKKVLIKMRKAQ